VTNLKTIFTVCFIACLIACRDNVISDKEVESKALRLTELLDSNSITIFTEWEYGSRGEVEIWSRLLVDSLSYNCLYFIKSDTPELRIGSIENFRKDFFYNYNIDTSRYNRISFLKIIDTTIRVTANDNQGRNTVLINSISQNQLFPKKDPYQHFDSLSRLKDRLGIIGTFHKPDLGNFIEFFLSPQHVLTYLPDNLYIDPKFKDVWLSYFATGRKFKHNWNLRKLDKPLESE
jgi:hypothetical protein